MPRSAATEEATVSFQVTQAGESRGIATVQLKHMVDRECGSHILRFTCALWVYNCTGVPLALQQSEMDDVMRGDNEVIPLRISLKFVAAIFVGKVNACLYSETFSNALESFTDIAVSADH